MVFHKGDKLLASMPGVPYEMKIAMEEQILPYIMDKGTMYNVQRDSIIHRTLQVTGIPESSLAILLEEYESSMPDELHLAYLPKDGMIRLRLSSYGGMKESEVDVWFERLSEIVRPYLIAKTDAPLEVILGNELKSRGQTIATAESCTGGKLGVLLNRHPGSSAFYKGTVVSYATSVKEQVLGVPSEMIESHTVVSEEVARTMAESVRKLLGADYGIATTGIASATGGYTPDQVGTVWIAWATPEGTCAECFHLGKLREQITDRACVKALVGVMKRMRGLVDERISG
jgi:nicotinamide-nucleotide amidase